MADISVEELAHLFIEDAKLPEKIAKQNKRIINSKGLLAAFFAGKIHSKRE